MKMWSLEGGKKLPLHVVRDNAKWVFLPTKVILSFNSCWPENHSKFSFWLKCFCIFAYGFFLFGNIHLATHANSDIGVIVLTLTFFIVIIEGISVYHMAITKKEKLNNLLNTMYHEFWSSDVVGERINNELLVSSRVVIFVLCSCTSAVYIGCVQFIATAVYFKYLPFLTTYPYNWWKSPYYELMLCFQSFFFVNLATLVFAGIFMFASTMSVYIAQFKLLKAYVKENVKAAILNDFKFKTKHAKKMLQFALNHHNKLIKVSQDINDIFKYYILLLFLTTIVSVCLSMFVVTFLPQGRLFTMSYFLGHILQIFIYCYMGNELLFESADLSDHFFHCGWHLTDTDDDFRKSLIMGIMRSQQPIKIMAGGFGYLQLSTFLSLIKFSFSVYTLLQSLVEKQGGQ